MIFNRPDLTRAVFKAIAAARPEQLFVIADGPRNRGENLLCQETRSVVNSIDWDCRIFKNYSENNLGCGKRVVSGLNWVFSQVEEAIVLEDDCVPAPSFFGFCEALLERYRSEPRIMQIAGHNFQRGIQRTPYSYYFSKYPHLWGWATWKRAWQRYDFEMKGWPDFKCSEAFKSLSGSFWERRFWTRLLDRYYFKRKPDTWDYPWLLACWAANGLSVIPERNLVSNIGFGINATHAQFETFYANYPTKDLWEIKHPPAIVRNQKADIYTYRYSFGSKWRLAFYVIPFIVGRRLKAFWQNLTKKLKVTEHV